jgi:hypothetical protein
MIQSKLCIQLNRVKVFHGARPCPAETKRKIRRRACTRVWRGMVGGLVAVEISF